MHAIFNGAHFIIQEALVGYVRGRKGSKENYSKKRV